MARLLIVALMACSGCQGVQWENLTGISGISLTFSFVPPTGIKTTATLVRQPINNEPSANTPRTD